MDPLHAIPPIKIHTMKGLFQSVPYFLITLYKALKAVFLLLVAFSLARAVEKHLPGGLQRALDYWFIGSERELYRNLASGLAKVSPKALRWATDESFLCGVITLVEVVGLVRRISPLVWLAIVDSALFLALGILDLTRHFTMASLILAAINAFIVWYLVTRRPKAARSSAGSSEGNKDRDKKPKKKPE